MAVRAATGLLEQVAAAARSVLEQTPRAAITRELEAQRAARSRARPCARSDVASPFGAALGCRGDAAAGAAAGLGRTRRILLLPQQGSDPRGASCCCPAYLNRARTHAAHPAALLCSSAAFVQPCCSRVGSSPVAADEPPQMDVTNAWSLLFAMPSRTADRLELPTRCSAAARPLLGRCRC